MKRKRPNHVARGYIHLRDELNMRGVVQRRKLDRFVQRSRQGIDIQKAPSQLKAALKSFIRGVKRSL